VRKSHKNTALAGSGTGTKERASTMTALGCLDTEGAALLIDNITDPFSTVEGVVVTIVAVNIDD